jgi:glycosyltransferase involved in cell wall biosynthesis
MKFLVITHVVHKKHDGKLYAYGPYVKEMNLWLKYADDFILVAPAVEQAPDPMDLAYDKHPELLQVTAFSLVSAVQILKTIFYLPFISLRILQGMLKADHIHLRLPGNMGLLGSVFQIFFPRKPKTVKYAGNWDPSASAPWSYKLQKSIVSSSLLTKNAKVLVYGEWHDRPQHIIPFFTASYREKEIYEIPSKTLTEPIKCLFAGTLSAGKRPGLALDAIKILNDKGIDARLDFYGDGVMRKMLAGKITEYGLEDKVQLHGKRPAEELKEAYRNAHFLIFPSRSEGWPKVVAEAMIWKCLPITTPVSAVPFMLDHGKRGSLVDADAEKIAAEIIFYLENPELYKQKTGDAHQWSKQFTLERFEKEIERFLR